MTTSGFFPDDSLTREVLQPHFTQWVDQWRINLGWAGQAAFAIAEQDEHFTKTLWLDNTTCTSQVELGGILARVSLSLPSTHQALMGTCTCTKTFDCEHALALALHLQYQAGCSARPQTWHEQIVHMLGGVRPGDTGIPLALLMDFSLDEREVWMTPLRQGQSGAWNRRGVSWAELDMIGKSQNTRFNPRHVALMLQGLDIAGQHINKDPHLPLQLALSQLHDQGFSWLLNLERAGVLLMTDIMRPAPVTSSAFTRQHVHYSYRDDGLSLSFVDTLNDRVSSLPAPSAHKSHALGTLVGNVRILHGGTHIEPDLTPIFTSNDATTQTRIHIPNVEVGEYLTFYDPHFRASQTHQAAVSDDQRDAAPVTLVAIVRTPDKGRTLTLVWAAQYEVNGRTYRCHLEEAWRKISPGSPPLRALDTRLAQCYTLLRRDLARRLTLDEWPLRTPTHVTDLTLPGYRYAELIDFFDTRLGDGSWLWEVDAESRTYLTAVPLLNEEAHIRGRVDTTSDIDWFSLDMDVHVGDMVIPLADVLSALNDGQSYMYVSGRWVSLDSPELHALQESVERARALSASDIPLLSRWHSHLWRALYDLADEWQIAPQWQRAMEQLPSSGELSSLPLANSDRLVLRPYQLAGHRWLTSLMNTGLGGVLADDMGLGKTVQVLAAVASYIASRRDAHALGVPILVVAPTSVVPVWGEEARRWFPTLRVELIRETTIKRGVRVAQVAQNADIVVTTYGIVREDYADFMQCHWGGCVLDEAHTVKNPATKSFRAVSALPRQWTIALTGTPVENSVTDLWALFRLACPGLLPAARDFQRVFVQPIDREGNHDVAVMLREAVAPFLLRRTKEFVAQELPAKSDTVVHVPLDEKARLHYDAVLVGIQEEVLGLRQSVHERGKILAALATLRKTAIDPGLDSPDFVGQRSAKTRVLLQYLRQIIPAGHRALVFSTFTTYLDRIEQALNDEGIATARLDGATRQREQVIDQFRCSDTPVFLISLKAGGVGLTLTEADYVFIMDPWWNPAAEEQAIDRTHRIGQDKPVTVYRLVAPDTVEERMLVLQERKRHIARDVVASSYSATGVISVDDLRALVM